MRSQHLKKPCPSLAASIRHCSRTAIFTLGAWTAIGATLSFGADFFFSDQLPPLEGKYIDPNAPAYWQVYAGCSITARLKNPLHIEFSTASSPPNVGQTLTYSFTSTVSGDVTVDGFIASTFFTAPATVQIEVTGVSDDGTVRTFDTEILQLDVSGGTLPLGVQVRESPTLASTGTATITTVPGGFLIENTYDVFSELRNPFNGNWVASTGAGTLELVGKDLVMIAAASSRQHGVAGKFELDSPLTAPHRIEPRQNGADPEMVLEFNQALVAADGTLDCGAEVVVTGGTCIGISTVDRDLIVDMTFDKNACVTVAVSGIESASSATPLSGDSDVSVLTHEGNATNPDQGDTQVNILDLTSIKNELFQPLSAANFWEDIDANGVINILDLANAKNNLFAPLPVCP